MVLVLQPLIIGSCLVAAPLKDYSLISCPADGILFTAGKVRTDLISGRWDIFCPPDKDKILSPFSFSSGTRMKTCRYKSRTSLSHEKEINLWLRESSSWREPIDPRVNVPAHNQFLDPACTGREKRVVLTFKPVLETINVLLFPSAGLQDVNYIAQRISLCQ